VTAAAAAGENQFSIPAELHVARKSFGEWQHADEFQIVGVVEDDLPGSGKGDDGCPGTMRDCRQRRRLIGADERLESETAWHGRRPFRFSDRDRFQRKIHRGLVRGERFAAGTLQHAAFDPPANDRDVALGNFRVRRHGRFVCMRNRFE
jgi:hypothetical protein